MRFATDDEAAASALWASHERAVGGIYHKLSRARAHTLVTPNLTHL